MDNINFANLKRKRDMRIILPVSLYPSSPASIG